ncbi:Putative pyridoxal kinase C6F6.11c [Psilocybe cubensis]|uniref:Pyridoxal kinase C6F6.11c n=2 Tax=Psilocybe cubensis TaxID=181762 RepID=A0ACB8GUV4_PSICU|nr:Putative pyridoxal kinase C6F6.11c [Psilocybe cubensis]KAH9479249.1 Putative pyridoxal kinase C6F6.11c [Psilocybe cubensis]
MANNLERVLSIQSHVVFGYVGGKAAVFPLQCLGYDVDVVNTVNFSNHSGYGRSGGTKTTAAELNSMFEIMEHNELLRPTRLLTGYIPGAEALSAVEKLAKKLKHSKPSLIYLLDPVMGDAGRLYVAADVIPVYQEMLPLATIITPNWFEVELLTGVELKDMPSLHRALDILHKDYHVPNVVISSIPLKSWLAAALPSTILPPSSTSSSHLLCISSSLHIPSAADTHILHTSASPRSTVHAQCVPLIPGYFSGVGDLFSALLLAHFHPDNTPENLNATCLSEAVSQALTKTHAILLMTQGQSEGLPEEERQPTDDELDKEDPLRKTRRMRGRELALVKGQDLIRGSGISHVREMMLWDGFWDGASS